MSSVPAGRCTVGVSIPVPPPYEAHVRQVRAQAGDPLADSMPTHITLLPPTEISLDQMHPLQAHLVQVAAAGQAFRLGLHGTGTFRPVSPVVFLALCQGREHCERLEAAVRDGPIERELDFPYHPHVTLAHHTEPAELDRVYGEQARYRAEFTVTGFDLHRLGDDQRWQPVRHFAFPATSAVC